MGEETHVRYFVTNHQNQPLELHLTTGLVVLGPGEETAVEKSALRSPQVEVLRRNRLIAIREAVEVLDPASRAEESPETAPAGQARKARKKEA
jgi:hypothetical protein